ncbi:MAG: hypothetical protein ACI85I_002460 [Arenicella sp.]
MGISGSYFFNQSDNNNESSLFEDYLNTRSPTEYLSADTTQNSNLNHRLNLRLQYKPNRKHRLTYIPSLTYQENSGTENSQAQTLIGNLLSNQINQTNGTDYNALDFQHKLIYSYRMNKRRRRLSLNISQGVSNSDGESALSYTSITTSDTSFFSQFSTLNSKKNNWRAGVSFSEPLSKKNSLYTRYNFSYSTESYDRFTYDTEASNSIVSEWSNVFETNYQTHKVEIGNQYRTKKVSLTTSLGYQTARLDNKQEFPSDFGLDNIFNNFLPSVRFRYKVSDSKNLRMDYRSSTQLPSVTNFQEVIDNSNALQLETGNSGLEQQTNHSVRVRYSANNTEKATVFFTYLNVQFADDYISNATYLATSTETFRRVDLDEGVQLSYPVNLAGYFSTRAFMSYGMPLEKIKSNLNINLDASYNRLPNLFNEQKNFIDNQKIGLGLVLGSNISENVDFTVSSRSNLDLAKSDFSEDTSL